MATTTDYLTQLQADKQTLKTNLQAKGVTVADTDTFTELSQKVASIPSGGGSIEEKDINFYDYDGTLLHSYSLDELPLSELPSAPSHTGLVFQEWNWDLEDINDLEIPMNIGANYTTDDGSTKFYITLDDNISDYQVAIKTSNTATEITIDWGDNNSTSQNGGVYTHTYAGAGNYIIKIYANERYYLFGNNYSGAIYSPSYNQYALKHILKRVELGDYLYKITSYPFYYFHNLEQIVISNSLEGFEGNNALQGCQKLYAVCFPKSFTSNFFAKNMKSLTVLSLPKTLKLNAIDGTCLKRAFTKATYIEDFTGNANLEELYFLGEATAIQQGALKSNSRLRKIKFPNGLTTIGNDALIGATLLKEIIIPSTVTSIGVNTLMSAFCLEKVVIPSGVQTIPQSFCSSCYNLYDVTIEYGVTSIGQSAFADNHRLPTIEIPPSVTNIGNNAFIKNYSLTSVYFRNFTSIPTIGTNVFQGINADCKIYVPADLLDEWKEATNWSTYASYIEAIPE